MFKECAMQYSILTGMHFAHHEYWQSLATLGKHIYGNHKTTFSL